MKELNFSKIGGVWTLPTAGDKLAAGLALAVLLGGSVGLSLFLLAKAVHLLTAMF